MSAEGREVLNRAWWISTFPGLAILSVVVACNLVGDGSGRRSTRACGWRSEGRQKQARILSSASRSVRSASSTKASTRCSNTSAGPGRHQRAAHRHDVVARPEGRPPISHALEGWPDHGVPARTRWKGAPTSRCVRNITPTPLIHDFASRDPEMAGRDILELVVPKAKARGMKMIPEFMEPLFKYAGHGLRRRSRSRTWPQCLEIDLLGRRAGEPMHLQSGISALVARHRRRARAQLRHRRHHVVQRAQLRRSTG